MSRKRLAIGLTIVVDILFVGPTPGGVLADMVYGRFLINKSK